LNSAVAVRNEREAYGWTQHDLAERSGLGLPQSTIARVENGANTSMDTISKIANAFGKSLKISFS
jgi:transcriptional regulator with XRE-family HTH domain